MPATSASSSLSLELQRVLSSAARLVVPENGNLYVEATKRYTEYHQPQPAIVVYPDTEADVAATVAYARAAGKPLLVSNTGHGYPTTMKAKADNGILLMVGKFKEMELSADKSYVTLGGGVQLKAVTQFLYENGKELTIGSCNGVGLLGASLGGGLGRLMGYHGLMADNILAVRLVLASGEIITVSDTENTDLFWAIKGAGHQFGVVLSAKYRVHDLHPLIYNANRAFRGDKLEAVIEVMNKVCPPAKEMSFYLTYAWFEEIKEIVVFIDYVYMGPEQDGRKKFNAMFEGIEYVAGWDAVHPWNKLNEDGMGGITKSLGDMGERKNTYNAWWLDYPVKTMRKLFDDYVKFLTAYPQMRKTLFAFESYPPEGVRAVPNDATAYPNRDCNIIVILTLWYKEPELDKVACDFGRKMRAVLFENSGFNKPRTYLNYGQGDESFEDVYGHEQWRLDRLKRLKAKYDPYDVFAVYQPIPMDKIRSRA